MTPDELRALVSAGESFESEFKSDRDRLGDDDLVESVTCLANGRGGTLLLGVEDDGAITGLHATRPRGDLTPLAAFIANRTIPSCTVSCDDVEIDRARVAVITVPRSRNPTATTQGVFRRRALDAGGRPCCRPFYFHEMQSRSASLGLLDPSALVVPGATGEDLDPVELARLRETIRRNPGRSDTALLSLGDFELMRTLGLVEGEEQVEQIRLAGLLMVGREASLERFVPTHGIAFQVLDGTRPAVNESFRFPLVRCTEEILARFSARNHEAEIDLGFVRVGIPDFSPQGFREAAMNALIHRDYAQLGRVVIQWSADDLEISNPGGFVEGVRLDTLITAGQKSRNPALVQAMHRIGLAEQLGRGIDAIYEGQLRFGRPAPDYSRTTDESVRVILPGGDANLRLVRFILTREQGRSRIGLEEMLVLNTLERERRLDVTRTAGLIQRSEGAARSLLERLVESGLLEARGERARRVFRFSAATYAALGEPAAHVRGAGFDTIQHATMVRELLFRNRRGTRAQVAELCRIDSDAAKALLQRMLADSEIVLHGQKRGAYYTLSVRIMESMTNTRRSRSKNRSKRTRES